MSKVWISGILGDSRVGDKPGIREKYFGHDWPKPTHILLPVPPSEIMDIIRRHANGETLVREEFPEAAYIFSEKHFARVKDFFYVGGFVAVKDKLAIILSEMDLGAGGLIPFPIYLDDKETRADGPFYFLNFGAWKGAFLPRESNQSFVRQMGSLEEDGVELWDAEAGYGDGDIAVSPAALEGADIWIESTLWSKIFMSERLVDAIRDAKIKIDFRLHACRIVE